MSDLRSKDYDDDHDGKRKYKTYRYPFMNGSLWNGCNCPLWNPCNLPIWSPYYVYDRKYDSDDEVSDDELDGNEPVPDNANIDKKDPQYYLNKALYFYYDQNPNFNPFLKPGAYFPKVANKKFKFPFYNFNNKSYYDKCPFLYYDAFNNINKHKKNKKNE
ncbi:MAG: hypothetical protein Satyrvirus1_66 [Satyrvirus sp.]|uniref:Uncharacterized protein n=1 Tax=Satyrvirus sp. TaxID=2487771 RepID=A0A3G5ACT1_9VIRU|nr:MAG: hypothetical protein Satyrvirus1_66 [Satyrvirus sp.]